MTVNSPVDVLLIEDDLQEAELAIRVLGSGRRRGYTVFHISDGSLVADYLSIFSDSPESPRLVLLDLKLPKLDGFAVLKKIKLEPRWSRIPVVVLSSSSIESDITKCYKLGANAYVVKPIRYADYRRTVERIAQFWLETVS